MARMQIYCVVAYLYYIFSRFWGGGGVCMVVESSRMGKQRKTEQATEKSSGIERISEAFM